METDLFGPVLTRANARQQAADAAHRRAQALDKGEARVERDIPGWITAALVMVQQFARMQAGHFTIEQLRAVLEPQLPPVTELRVWGVVTVRAKNAGFIAPVPKTFIAAASSNNCAKQAWRRGPQA
jgi:hypothetical protein